MNLFIVLSTLFFAFISAQAPNPDECTPEERAAGLCPGEEGDPEFAEQMEGEEEEEEE